MEYSPKVIILNGSPRRYGSSMQLSMIAAKGVSDAGGVPEVISLTDYRIKPCMGCVSDGNKYCKFPCVITDDDFNAIAEKLLESDGLIISTPVYWYAPSGVLKNFIDRLTSMEHMIFHGGRSLLEGKVTGFIATGLDSGVMYAIAYLAIVMSSMGAHVIPWSMAYSHLEDVARDEQALRDSYNIGLIVTETARALRRYGHIGYKPDVDINGLARIAAEYRVSMQDHIKRRVEELEELVNRAPTYTEAP